MTTATMTRADRKAANKAAHAIRRSCTEVDYREAKSAGHSITWRAVWDTYAAIDAVTVISTLGTPAPVKVAPKPKRKAPAHVERVAVEYRLAREAWESGLEAAMAGGSRKGKPARGEKYTDEERDYRAAYPAPVYRDFLKQAGREARGMVDAAIASGHLAIVSVSA